MNVIPRRPLCLGCAETQDLMIRVADMMDHGAVDPNVTMENVPLMLESAASLILSEFDYVAHENSRTAFGLRLLAAATLQVDALLERSRYLDE